MKSYGSSLTFVKVDLLFHELLPLLQIQIETSNNMYNNVFSGLFCAMLSHILMKVGSKFSLEEFLSNTVKEAREV